MLILSRKPGEKILVGEDVVITIVRIGPSSVRLGIEAPQGVSIMREELVVVDDAPPLGEEDAGESDPNTEV